MNENIIKEASRFVKSEMLNANDSGHDWQHTYRVWQQTLLLAKETNCNLYVAELGALFHDIADAKFNDGDESLGEKITYKWLKKHDVNNEITEKVIFIVNHVSYRKKYKPDIQNEPELAIVQDADRLDAMGALGIARAFSYGGFKNRPLYPTEEYKTGSTIEHFHEKLLHLRALMNTKAAQEIAQERHLFMIKFLDQFSNEIDYIDGTHSS